MNKILSCILFCYLGVICAQQNNSVYPEGIYATFNDFALNEPSLDTSITSKQGNNVIITTFRIKDANGNKIKDAFAVSDGEHVYVRTNAMLEHLTNSEPDKPNATNKDYSIAKLVNTDFLYFEVFFQSKSARNWGIGKVYLSGIIFNRTTGKFTFLESFRDLSIAGIPTKYNNEDDERINGQNIDLARIAILPLFKGVD